LGEPIWKGRGPAELVESQRHEALLNVAFAGGQAWYLLCPYDTDSLEPEVVEEAFRSHPFTSHSNNGTAESGQYVGLEAESAPFDAPLPEPLGEPPEFSFQAGPMGGLRRLVAGHALDAGLTSAKTSDLVLAVTEVAGNSLRHGGGEGVLRIWQDPATLYCEVRDRGYIPQPLVGRERIGCAGPTDLRVDPEPAGPDRRQGRARSAREPGGRARSLPPEPEGRW